MIRTKVAGLSVVPTWYLERLEDLVESEWGGLPTDPPNPVAFVATPIDPSLIAPVSGIAAVMERAHRPSNVRGQSLPELPPLNEPHLSSNGMDGPRYREPYDPWQPIITIHEQGQ